MYLLDENSKTPLHIQLYEAIKAEILNERSVGDKLPSIRKVASRYNLSKTTVESAYAQLYAEGYIESRPKSGYFVCELYFDTFKQPRRPDPSWRYDFFPARLHSDDFPLKLWKRLYARVLDEQVDFGAYPDGQGEPELRDQIARYLQDSRGVRCEADQVIVTHGFGDSMELLAKLVRERYTHFAHELPGYHIAPKVFAAYGYRIHPIGVTDEGIDIEQLAQSPAQVVYITPTHQYPTGAAMPISKRQRLIRHMQSLGGLIIEDDYDSELSYRNRPIPSLQGLDHGECVVYLGTFAKALSPALRVGYMVVPPRILERFKASYDAHFARVSLTTQLTLAHFMKEGHWQRHINRMRNLNKKKHQAMIEALKRHLGDSFEIVAQGAGLSVHIVSTDPDFDYPGLKKRAAKNRIALYLAQERSGGDYEAVRLGFGGFRLEEIDEAVAAFAEVWKGHRS